MDSSSLPKKLISYQYANKWSPYQQNIPIPEHFGRIVYGFTQWFEEFHKEDIEMMEEMYEEFDRNEWIREKLKTFDIVSYHIEKNNIDKESFVSSLPFHMEFVEDMTQSHTFWDEMDEASAFVKALDVFARRLAYDVLTE